MATNKPKHILIAPLDWGMGHTTRCMPIIAYLLSLGHVVKVACNQSQRSFIEETFSGIDFIHLNGYNITYSKWNKWAQAGLISQMPGILKTIKSEHKWLKNLVKDQKIDGIISDNRYGLYHSIIPSVIMTHQLRVRSGLGQLADQAIQHIHFKQLERFNNSWVVDNPSKPDLGGALSHSESIPANAEYIGLLSRFSDLTDTLNTSGLKNNDSEVLIMLSGPEPQRSEISCILWQQATKYPGKISFIEGREDVLTPVYIPAHISYYKRLTSDQLLPLLAKADIVICRSGYSSLMDLTALRKKAILIPTPGQTEQIYLSKYLDKGGVFYATSQKGFDLAASLKNVDSFPFKTPIPDSSFMLFKQVVKGWVESL